jgi:hypothetical protein
MKPHFLAIKTRKTLLKTQQTVQAIIVMFDKHEADQIFFNILVHYCVEQSANKLLYIIY